MIANFSRRLAITTLLFLLILALAGCTGLSWAELSPGSPTQPAAGATTTAASADPARPISLVVTAPTRAPVQPGGLVVYFLDVGQGNATLLAGPDFTILVDAGRHDRDDVVPYLQAAGVGRLIYWSAPTRTPIISASSRPC
jgi:beta-lactamase superfamily II metal-dependent hydrolase